MHNDKAKKLGDGFTLIELLIVIAILATLAGIGLVIGADSYQRYVFRSERDTIVSVLGKARSEAMNNIGALPSAAVDHGVRIEPASIILFRGTSYATRNSAFDFIVPRSAAVTASGVSEVVFAPLSGDVTTGIGTLALTDGRQSATITINGEGQINW